jgi:hypothetical protein
MAKTDWPGLRTGRGWERATVGEGNIRLLHPEGTRPLCSTRAYHLAAAPSTLSLVLSG